MNSPRLSLLQSGPRERGRPTLARLRRGRVDRERPGLTQIQGEDDAMTRFGLPAVGSLLAAALLQTGCQGAPDRAADDGVRLQFVARTDVHGNCRPERVVGAYTDASGLRAIRGEADYVMPTGTTHIPFQTVFRGMDNRGYSKSDAVTVLNHDGPCADLVININIQRCEFIGDGPQTRTACPDFNVTGYDAFSGVNIRRSDRT